MLPEVEAPLWCTVMLDSLAFMGTCGLIGINSNGYALSWWWMKDIPGNLPLKAYHAITSKKLSRIGTLYKTCLIGGDGCPEAIRSHSVPVSALGSIANDGHVYTFTSPTHDELESIYNGCKYPPKPYGINEASTYYGFCSHHDDSIFWRLRNVISNQ